MAINHTYSYENTLTDSLKIHWNVDDLIGGNKSLDFRRAFLPDSLARTNELRSLSAEERLILNQIRGATYLHLFGPSKSSSCRLPSTGPKTITVTTKLRTRALLGFAEEEAKHQQLFQRFSSEFAKGFQTPIEFIGPASAIADKVLSHSQLAVSILILHLEWLTQRHYLEASKPTRPSTPNSSACSSTTGKRKPSTPSSILWWLQNSLRARHLPRLKPRSTSSWRLQPSSRQGYSNRSSSIWNALEKAIGRTLSTTQRDEIRKVQLGSYRYTFLVSGIEQKNFAAALKDLSTAGAARVNAAAAALS